jgi:hypothetical protein
LDRQGHTYDHIKLTGDFLEGSGFRDDSTAALFDQLAEQRVDRPSPGKVSGKVHRRRAFLPMFSRSRSLQIILRSRNDRVDHAGDQLIRTENKREFKREGESVRSLHYFPLYLT